MKSYHGYATNIEDLFNYPGIVLIAQRGINKSYYYWGKKQCRGLYDTITTSMETKHEQDFGTITLKNTQCEHEFIIIDGLQRLTSVTLLMLGLDFLLSYSVDPTPIEDVYFFNDVPDDAADYERFKLHLNEPDDTIFRGIITVKGDCNILPDQQRDSHIYTNYDYLRCLIKETIVRDNRPISDFVETMHNLAVTVNLG